MKIEVTVDDIMNGQRGSRDKCPIARAAVRAGLAPVEVSQHFLYFAEGPGQLRHFVLPDAAETFVERYDKGLIVQPFSFELDGTDDKRTAIPKAEGE